MEVFLWFPEWEEFDSHGGEDDVGVAHAVDADAEEDSGWNEGDEAEPPVIFEVYVPRAPVDVFIE